MFTAARLSPVPLVGATDIEGIALPRGRQVIARQTDNPAAVAWISDKILHSAELTALMQSLAALFPKTGLWPVHVDGDSLQSPRFDGALSGPDTRTLDAIEVLTSIVRSGPPADIEVDKSRLPELAFTVSTDPARIAQPSRRRWPVPWRRRGAADPMSTEQLLPLGNGGLLLVPVHRPADVPKALGWQGAADHGAAGEQISAILRSWEDRFDATLVGIGSDAMELSVPALSFTDDEQIHRLVSEHYAFCPDNLDLSHDIDDYIADLPGSRRWSFWWS